MSRSARRVAVSDSSTPATEHSPTDVSVSWPAYFYDFAYQHWPVTHVTEVFTKQPATTLLVASIRLRVVGY